ncbi:MAG: hypothetical protein ACREN5_14215, partial [Gemmatimonadales bacterium]
FDLLHQAREWRSAHGGGGTTIISEMEIVARWLAGDFSRALAVAEDMVAGDLTGLSRRQVACLTMAGLAAVEADRLNDARRYLDLVRATFFGSNQSGPADG